jgi:formylglycine-generating enzyme required for sulfatase activity
MRAAQESFSAESGLPVEVENSIGMRFRLVPPGTAILGSPVEEPGRGEAETQHVVVVPTAFYLGACEVTQAEWSRCTPANLSRYPGARRPVEEVSWYDCQRFLAALCQTEGLAEGTYRLPTEGEWEYACRAGTTTAFCSGDAPLGLDAVATHADNGSGGTADVDTKRPNALGLFEMHGNVWEWCLDRFGPYPGADQPPEPEHENWRCLRGGNWYVPRLDCRSAERGRLPPPSTGSMLGFRVLREIGAETHTAPEPPTP